MHHCPICEKSYKREGNLVRHVADKHLLMIPLPDELWPHCWCGQVLTKGHPLASFASHLQRNRGLFAHYLNHHLGLE